MPLEKLLPQLACAVYSRLTGTRPDSAELIFRSSAVWLMLTDGPLHHLLRIPWEDVEDFSLLLTEADPTACDGIPYVTERLEELLREKIAA